MSAQERKRTALFAHSANAAADAMHAAADIIKSRDAEIARLRAALVNIATLPPLRAGEASRIAERALEPVGRG